MLDLKSKSQFLSAKFSFYIMQTYSKNPMKNSKSRKETHSHRNPQRLLPDISIFLLRLVFQSFDVHLSLIYNKKSEHKANEAKQGEFLDNVSKYRKIVGRLFKAKWYELGQLWLSFLSGVNKLSHYLTKTVYLFVNKFNLHGLFLAEFHNTNTSKR